MKKKSRGLVFLLSAAITFASLFAIVGKPNYAKHFNKCNHQEVQHQEVQHQEVQ